VRGVGRPAALLVVALLVVGLGGAGRPAAGDPVTRVTLDNGMTVLVRENPLAPVVAVTLLVRTGSRWEEPATAGISNFLHAVMVKGTRQRSGAALAEAVAGIGGKLSAAGDVDYSAIQGTALARFWRDLLGLTAELALEPVLSPDEVEREREWLLSRVQRRRDSPAARAFDELYAALYGPHPYGLPVLGTRESLARIAHADIVAHYRRYYRPERLTLAVSGDVEREAVVAEVARLFGGLPRATAVAADPPLPSPPPGSRRVVLRQAAQQAQVVTAGLGPPLDHPDHAPAKVLATVLGGGMAGRLFVEIRDRSGLAYAATAFYDALVGPAPIVLYLGTAPETAAAAEAALQREVERVRQEPVSPDELRRAKGYLLGNDAMDRRTNARRAWYLAFYELTGVGRDFSGHYRAAVEAVTAADVLRVARRYLGTTTTVVLEPAR
jgi:zinc protease